MKKKIGLIVVAFMLFASVVSASSINGDYKGSPIVKIKSNGKVLPVDDTPAIIFDSRTMVPIYMLKQLGADVIWDGDTYSVDVEIPKSDLSNTTNLNHIKNKVLEADNFVIVENTAENIQTFVGMIDLYYRGVSDNFSTRYTSVELEQRFSQVASTTNNNIDLLNDFIKNNKYLDNEKLKTHLTDITTALELVRKTKNNLLYWESLRTADPKKSREYFDLFLSANDEASIVYNRVIGDAHINYNQKISEILNMQ